jgi:hypothetical protein
MLDPKTTNRLSRIGRSLSSRASAARADPTAVIRRTTGPALVAVRARFFHNCEGCMSLAFNRAYRGDARENRSGG